MNTHIEHGGALDRAMARFGGKAEEWLDLSTGINPEHFPLPDFTPALWNRLPDEGLLKRVLVSARRYYNVADDASILAAPEPSRLFSLSRRWPNLLRSRFWGQPIRNMLHLLQARAGTWSNVRRLKIFRKMRALSQSLIRTIRMGELSRVLICLSWR